MSKPLNTIEIGTRNVNVNGKEFPVTVRAYVYADEPILDWDFEPGEKEKLIRDLDNGNVLCAYIVVKATADGIEGADSLGGTYVYNPQDVDNTVSEYGMVDNACKDFVTQLQDQIESLKKYTA